MKKLFGLTIVLLQMNFASCSDQVSADGPPYTARILASDGSNYGFRDVTFQTLTDIDHVEGSVTAVLGDASLNADAGIDEIISPDARDSIYLERGKRVRLDYVVKSGVIHPKNFDSMAMLAMYYNYEQTILYWEQNLGLDIDEFGLLRMFYAPRVKREVSGTTVEGSIKVNAAFLPGPRDFFFFKTSPIEALPINMNYAVMAHEFSHAIFDLQFAGKDATVYETTYDPAETRLRAINEGIADFYAFVVTRRVEEFGESLESLKEYRTIPVPWRISNVGTSGCTGGAYCEGSLLASALYEITSEFNVDPLVVGRHVFNALPNLREAWFQTRDGIDFDYHLILNVILDEVANANEDLTPYCTSFFKFFDTTDIQSKVTRCNT